MFESIVTRRLEMYDDLLNKLANMGLNWSRRGLESHDWMKTEDTDNFHWIIDTAEAIITGYNPNEPESFPEVEPRALILLSQACMLLLQNSDGVASKDLAMMAFQIEMERGEFDLEMLLLAQGLMASGRYIDCVGYFHTKYNEGVYDESFLPDVIEVLDDLEQWFQKLISAEMEWQDDEFKDLSCLECLALMIKIARGAYLQLEMGLEIMSVDQIKNYVQQFAPRAATIALHYVTMERLSKVHYAISHSFIAYSTYILVALKSIDFPMSGVLDSVNKGCLDHGNDLTPEEKYFTLFAHVLRLRIFSKEQMNISGNHWEDAVNRADEALAESAKINAYDTYAQVIENLKIEGRIINLQNYADKLGRNF